MRRSCTKWWFGLRICIIGMFLFFPYTTDAEQPERINFLHFYGSPHGSRAINSLVEVINTAHPAFVIESTKFDQESFKTAIQAMLSGGNPPDIFTYWAGARVQAIVDAGYLEPLDDLWEQANLTARFGPAMTRASTYNGHKYVIPLNQYYAAFFYNTAIFKEHGLTPPTTWTEFLTVCDTLKAAGITPIALGSQERWPAQFWFDYLLLRTAGPEYRQQLMTGHAAYTDPEVQHVYRLWQNLIARGYFNQTPNVYTWSEATRMVVHGQAAMLLMGNWVMSLFEGQLDWQQQQDYDFFPFPIIAPDLPLASLGPIDCVVLLRARKIQAAKTVLPFFSDIAPQQQMSKATGSLSPNQQMPVSFYTDLQQRMLHAISESPYWAFNYDLATPPPVAEIGLQSFMKFLEQPDRYLEILNELKAQANAYFHTQ